jgi:hypothetical protein
MAPETKTSTQDIYDDNELRSYINDLQQNAALMAAKLEETWAKAGSIGQLDRTAFLLTVAAVDEMYRRKLEEALANAPPLPTDMPIDTDEKMTRETGRIQEYLGDVEANLSGSRWDQDFISVIRRAETEADSDLLRMEVPTGLHPARFRLFHIAYLCREKVEQFLARSIGAAKEHERQMLQMLKERPEVHKRR